MAAQRFLPATASRVAHFVAEAQCLKQHAAEAFDLDVVDYLLKPWSEERVRECVTRVARRRARRDSTAPVRIVARSKRGLVFLQQTEVWAFEASERLSYVHGQRGRFDVDLSLAAIEMNLGPGWLRVHRNWVINQAHVQALERDELGTTLVLAGATAADDTNLRVPVARDRVQMVRDVLLLGTTGIRS